MAYSIDLRMKVVEAYKNKIGSMSELANMFSMSIATVNNFVSKFRKTNNVEPKKYPGRPAKKTSIDRLNLIRQLVDSSTHSTLKELCKKYKDKTGDYISKSHMDNTLKKLNITLKKKTYMHRNVIQMKYR